MNTITDVDVEAFALHVARLQHEHNTRSEEAGAMRSAAAIRSWGAKVPPALDICMRDRLVEEHRTAWLRDAEAAIRTLDFKAFANGTFHVIDGREIGMPTDGYMGISVVAHMHIIARDYLPRTARNPVAAVAVLPEVVAKNTCGTICHARDAAIGQMRAAVAATAAHEYSHHVVAVVEGETIPATASIEGTINLLRTKGSDKPRNARAHGGPWCRAFAHLVKRAAFLPHHAVWIERYRQDVRHAARVDPDAVLDALHTEFVRFTASDALVDVLRSPAPAGFLKLFDPTKEANHASDS